MGCLHSKLRPFGRAEDLLVTQQEQSLSSLPAVISPKDVVSGAFLQGVKLQGVATSGDAALLFSRLVIARGHIFAAVFEGHISPSAAEYCRSHCWDAFVQASASRQQTPVAAALTCRPLAFAWDKGWQLRALDRGFLTSSKHSLESRLSSGCSATLFHVDLAIRTVTVATVGAHGTVGLGSTSTVAPMRSEVCGDGAAEAITLAVHCPRIHGAGLQQRGSNGKERKMDWSEDASRRRQHLVPPLCAVEGSWPRGLRSLRQFVTLESPRTDDRYGLPGFVDLVQSALVPSNDHQSVAAAAVAPSGFQSDELSAASTTGASGLTQGQGVATLSFERRTAAHPQLLGFDSPKDALLVVDLDNASLASAATVVHHAHAQQQPAQNPPQQQLVQATPSGGCHLAAPSRLHCGCDVRVSSRPLAAGDECLVLLAGCGGAGGRGATGADGGSSNGGVESGANGRIRAFPGRSLLGGGNAGSSGQVGVSSSVMQQGLRAPGSALSAADAVLLVDELAAAVQGLVTRSNATVPAPIVKAASGDNHFDILYDNYEASVTSALAAASGESRTTVGAMAALASPQAARFRAGDAGAAAVASYAVAAALKNRGFDGVSRAQTVVDSPSVSAACIAIWLDWDNAIGGAADSAGVAVSTQVPGHRPVPPPPSSSFQAALRWQLLRAYCRFLVARRRRILAAWHTLVTAVADQRSSPQQPPSRGASLRALGSVGCVARESCSTVVLTNRSASFTSRPPVMMEFVEELPSTPTLASMTGVMHVHPGHATGLTGDDFPIGWGQGIAVGIGSSTSALAASTAATTGLDGLQSHSAAPFGISGLVMAPMGSSESERMEPSAAPSTAATATAVLPSTGTSSGNDGSSVVKRQQPLLSQRSFMLPFGTSISSRTKAMLGFRTSHSASDLHGLDVAVSLRGSNHSQSTDSDGSTATATTVATAAASIPQRAVEQQEIVLKAAAVEGAGWHGSHASASSTAHSAANASGNGRGVADVGGGGGGGSGALFDWSLVMSSVVQNSGSRDSNSAGHTPIPSTTASRLSPIGFSQESEPVAAGYYHYGGAGSSGSFPGPGGDTQAAAAGGYLSNSVGSFGSGAGSLRLKQTWSVPSAQGASPRSLGPSGGGAAGGTSPRCTTGLMPDIQHGSVLRRSVR